MIQIWSMDSCAQTRCPMNMTLMLRTDTTTPEILRTCARKNVVVIESRSTFAYMVFISCILMDNHFLRAT